MRSILRISSLCSTLKPSVKILDGLTMNLPGNLISLEELYRLPLSKVIHILTFTLILMLILVHILMLVLIHNIMLVITLILI